MTNQQKENILFDELKLLKNSNLKKWVVKILLDLPEYFWTVPASMSGKHHAKDEQGEYGLIIHTKKVVYFANELCRAYDVGDTDCIIAACILHDGIKYGVNAKPDGDESRIAFQQHPERMAKRILEYNTTDSGIDNTRIFKISEFVGSHSGKWSNEGFFPKSKGAWIVHLADYIGSREKVVSESIVRENAWKEAAEFALERFGTLKPENIGVGVENTLSNLRARKKLIEEKK